MRLKSHQVDLLRGVCRCGSLPTSTTDGRVLRPLLRLDLVVERGTRVYATPAGQRAVLQERPRAATREETRETAFPGKLSGSQEEVLRYLLRQTGPVPVDHLDGRVLRALLARGLAEESRGWASPTAAAAEFLRGHVSRSREKSERRAANSPRAARSEAILRATDELELALPRGAEVMIGSFPAYGDDVVSGLRQLARQLE